ncbi:MAG: hypothetical protein ABI114_15130 [Rhodanobacter sp.]
MPHRTPSLLFRLRRHRGLLVLAIAVLLLKFLTGTVCLANDTGTRIISATTTPTTMPAEVTSAASSDTYVSACVLGEVGGCHCTCAHNAPLAVTTPMPLLRLDAPAAPTSLQLPRAPAIAGLLHRPPIA